MKHKLKILKNHVGIILNIDQNISNGTVHIKIHDLFTFLSCHYLLPCYLPSFLGSQVPTFLLRLFGDRYPKTFFSYVLLCCCEKLTIMFDRHCEDSGQGLGSDSVNFREITNFSILSCSTIPLFQYNIYLFILAYLVVLKILVK